MERIFFQPKYKNSLINKNKNMTIRYGNEMGKYKLGGLYHVVSYSGRIDFGFKIKVKEVKRLSLNELQNLNIHKSSVKKLTNETLGPVEIIRFEIIK